MRVTAKGEYATQAVLHLALRHPRVVAIHEIAERHHIPIKYLEQILLELKRGGILASRRGLRGGYTLARAPQQVSVGEVLRLVDGPFSQSSCALAAAKGTPCTEGDVCGLRQMWQEVQDTVDAILYSTSFADLCARTKAVPSRSRPVPKEELPGSMPDFLASRSFLRE